MSVRLKARVERDFDAPGSAERVLGLIQGAADSERIQAAIVFSAAGDVAEVDRQVALAAVDWRDVLVNGGLAEEDWPAVLDRELGA